MDYTFLLLFSFSGLFISNIQKYFFKKSLFFNKISADVFLFALATVTNSSSFAVPTYREHLILNAIFSSVVCEPGQLA